MTAGGPVDRLRAAPMDSELRRRLQAIAAATPGVLAEDKGYSMALHYRLAPQAERFVREEIGRACAAVPHVPIEILPGKSMYEVKPPAFNKGMAVRELMRQEPFQGPPPDLHRRRRHRRERVRGGAGVRRPRLFGRPQVSQHARLLRDSARSAALAVRIYPAGRAGGVVVGTASRYPSPREAAGRVVRAPGSALLRRPAQAPRRTAVGGRLDHH